MMKIKSIIDCSEGKLIVIADTKEGNDIQYALEDGIVIESLNKYFKNKKLIIGEQQ